MTRNQIPVISGKQKDKNPRIETGIFKYPEALKNEIVRIHEKEHRSASSIIYYLLVRGVKSYNQDGVLFEDNDELAFLERRRA